MMFLKMDSGKITKIFDEQFLRERLRDSDKVTQEEKLARMKSQSIALDPQSPWTVQYSDFQDVANCPDLEISIPKGAWKRPYQIAYLYINSPGRYPYLRFYSPDGFVGELCPEFQDLTEYGFKKLALIEKLMAAKQLDEKTRAKHEKSVVGILQRNQMYAASAYQAAVSYLKDKFQVVIRNNADSQ